MSEKQENVVLYHHPYLWKKKKSILPFKISPWRIYSPFYQKKISSHVSKNFFFNFFYFVSKSPEDTLFENHSNCRIWIFELLFVIFNELLFTKSVNVARFARSVECDFLCDFRTLWEELNWTSLIITHPKMTHNFFGLFFWILLTIFNLTSESSIFCSLLKWDLSACSFLWFWRWLGLFGPDYYHNTTIAKKRFLKIYSASFHQKIILTLFVLHFLKGITLFNKKRKCFITYSI